MDVKAYDYMDWPRIEAVVYGEEASPRDVMSPRLTPEGVLIQGFFPDAEKVEIESGGRTYPTEQEDEAGYFAALIPGRKIPAYKFLVTKDGETEEYADPYAFDGQITEDEEKAFCAGRLLSRLRQAGSPSCDGKRNERRQLRGLGAQCGKRQRGGRF